MDKTAVTEIKENLYASWIATLAPLTDKAFKLTSRGESKVNGRPVLGVKVSREGHRDVQLFFDKGTGLLTRSSTRAKDLFQGGDEQQAEELYSEYKDFDVVKRPTKVKQLRDGKEFVEVAYSDYTLSEKLDDKLFAGGPGGKPGAGPGGFPGGKPGAGPGGFPGGKPGGPGGFPGGGPGGFPGGRPGAGPGGFGMQLPRPGEILPSFLQETLKLTDKQKKEITDLQKEVDGKVEKILTDDQKAQFKKLREAGPGGFPGGFPGGGPGGFPGGGPGGFPGGKPGGKPGGFPGGKPGDKP